MGYKLRCIVILCVGILHFSCTNFKSPNQNLDDAVMINVSMKPEKIDFVDLIENVQFIPLETSSISLIGDVDKIICYHSDYYILDREKSKGLYRFNAEGKFLNMIGRNGRGPGEYSDPADFIVNSSGLIVLDHRSRTLLFYDYDGNYKSTVPLEYIIYEITGMQDENLIFAVAGDNRHRNEAKDYETLILNVNGEFVSAGIHNKFEMNYSYPYCSFLYDGKIKYSKSLRSMTYAIDSEGVYGDYYINILDSPLPTDYEQECKGNFEQFRKKFRGNYNYFGGKFFENDDVVFFTTQDKERQSYWNVYDKETTTTSTGLISLSTQDDTKRFGPKDMIFLSGINSHWVGQGEDIIGCLSAVSLTLDDFSLEFPALDSLKINDNPVVFRFKFKL